MAKHSGHKLGHDKEPVSRGRGMRSPNARTAVVHSHSARPKRGIKGGGRKRFSA